MEVARTSSDSCSCLTHSAEIRESDAGGCAAAPTAPVASIAAPTAALAAAPTALAAVPPSSGDSLSRNDRMPAARPPSAPLVRAFHRASCT